MTDQYGNGSSENDALDIRAADTFGAQADHQPEAEPLRAERLAPHSIDAEEAVLGSAMLNGQVLSELTAFLHADDFFIRRHGIVWEALKALYDRNDHIDDLTVIHELETQGQLEQIGGAAFISRLIANTPTYIHATTYGHLVEVAATRRRLIAAAAEIAQAAQDESTDITQVIDRSETTLFAVTERNLRRDILPMRAAISTYYRQIEYQYAHRGEPVGLPSGFADLDQLLGGIQKSDLLVVAARPGVGKTSFLLSAALNAARYGGARVGIFSMEMSNEQLVQRLVSAETGINSQKLRSGNLDDGEWSLFTQAVVNLGQLPMYLDDSPGVTPSQLRAKCRRLYREYGLDLIVVDYLQLMESGVGHNDNRVQEIGYISRNLKELARELNVPLLAAAQLSRQVEQRADKRPQLSDLRESGSIEQDSDIVMFIYRDEMYNEQSERPNQADIIVAKHRNGPTGVITLHFNKTLTKFGNLKHDTYNLNG